MPLQPDCSQTESSAKLRIVMPVLNEGAALTARLAALQSLRAQGAELVVVDGGSTDESWARARPWVDHLIASAPGRALQMNAGADAKGCRPAQALLFLHADTALPADALQLIEAALRERPWGRFDVRLDAAQAAFRMIETLMNLRSRLSGIATGDQAIFVRSDVFHAVGGFPIQALMEDIELSGRLRNLSRPACLRERVQASARKWQKSGIWRTIFLMWRLRLAYFFGADPADLALAYGYKAALPPAKAAVAILAKAPVAGLAKTRLIPALGAAGAARAQRHFCLQTIYTATQSRLGAHTLWCAPDPEHRHFRAIQQRFGIANKMQPEGDIGDRMQRAAQMHFAKTDAPPLLIIGTDCAVLAPGHLQEAARSLMTHDICLIPAEDGGYVLIGMRKMIPEVFQEVAWSTSAVLAQTLSLCALAGASVAQLPSLWDIDEPADWQRWQAMLSTDTAQGAP
jgi:rSAM/selenodomain-associated transferase 2/rSAM/selenodomain-associated transferase 1